MKEERIISIVKQPKPRSFNIGMTEGCNLFCEQCAIRTQYKTHSEMKYSFLSVDLAEQISKDIMKFTGDKIRVEFSLQGEPTINKDLFDIVQLFRTELPLSQITVTTNGIIPRKEGLDYVESLFDSGTNIIIMSDYHNQGYSMFEGSNRFRTVDIADKESKEECSPYKYHNGLKVLQKTHDIKTTTGKTFYRNLFNMAGNVDFSLVTKYGLVPIQKPLQSKCGHPFRDMVIKSTGECILCCQDWKNKCVVGKFPEQDLETIWNSKIFRERRTQLIFKDRTSEPCNKCDYNGGTWLEFLKIPSNDWYDEMEKRKPQKQSTFNFGE